jgi:hypothetical protein
MIHFEAFGPAKTKAKHAEGMRPSQCPRRLFKDPQSSDFQSKMAEVPAFP